MNAFTVTASRQTRKLVREVLIEANNRYGVGVEELKGLLGSTFLITGATARDERVIRTALTDIAV